MNSNQIQSLIRTVLLAAGAGLVTKGVVSDGQLQEIVGAALSIASILWSQFHHKNNPPAS